MGLLAPPFCVVRTACSAVLPVGFLFCLAAKDFVCVPQKALFLLMVYFRYGYCAGACLIDRPYGCLQSSHQQGGVAARLRLSACLAQADATRGREVARTVSRYFLLAPCVFRLFRS